MSDQAYVFLPQVPFVTEQKTKQEIIKVLNEKYPKGEFKTSNIIISRKQNKYNAYVQTNEQHKENLLELKEIMINGQIVNMKKCFPYHQIYINKLPDNINKQQIHKYFWTFGQIQSIQLLPAETGYENNREKLTYNHCYIRYQNNQSAEDCLFTENRHSIKNKEDIRVVRAYKIGQNDETDKKLFLKITPVVQFNINKVEKQLFNYFSKLGELREKIRIQEMSNISSRACVTFTTTQAGDKALQKFALQKFQQYVFVLRPFASKESHMAFVQGVILDTTTQQKLKTALSKYGKINNCTLNPSKKQGIANAIVSFSDQQGLKSALAQYNTDKQLIPLFVSKPYMDMHMNASLRNEFKSFQKKDRKPIENPLMSIGGIGMGYGVPRVNPSQSLMGMNPPQSLMGMNQPQGLMGMNGNMGMMNSTMGMNPNMPPTMGLNVQNNRMPPQNYRPPL